MENDAPPLVKSGAQLSLVLLPTQRETLDHFDVLSKGKWHPVPLNGGFIVLASVHDQLYRPSAGLLLCLGPAAEPHALLHTNEETLCFQHPVGQSIKQYVLYVLTDRKLARYSKCY